CMILKSYAVFYDKGENMAEWKKVKLGEIFSERIEKNSENLMLLAITGAYGIVPRSELDLKDNSSEDKSKYLKIYVGDIGYNTMRMWQGVSAYSDYEGIVSPAYTVLKPKSSIDSKYFSYLFKMPEMIFKFYRYSQGLVDDTRNLKYQNFRNIYVFFPADKKEQQKIAEILSTQDKLIELKQKLIDNKKQQKKWLMQNLLTAKIRLKGFSGEWKKVKLGEIFSERTERNSENLMLLAVTGTRGIIPRSELDLKDNSSEDKSKYLKICVGDIGYNTMRMWQGVSAYSNYKGIVSPAYTVLKPAAWINSKYFSYLFKMPEIIFNFYRFSQGLVDDTRNLKYNNFSKIKVFYPVKKNEQNAIAEILSTQDKEIELLEKELKQEKLRKKALMQLLLTGKIRVV
ncbi:MAG: restriction endonuclease subunit S, partial [Ruminococcus sp.]|nr:restriction endonuclease subunit S [Ruminococcus sp.]